jgi:hypothetical protein
VLNVRKLAAIDLYFLGSKFILAEFGLGMAGLGALGWFTLRAGIRREHGAWLIAWGLYMLGLGINYVPLFLHAISIARRGRAREEIADELGDRRGAARKYRRQSLVILIPMVVLVLATMQELRRRQGAYSRAS